MVTGSMIRYCQHGRSRRTAEMADGFPPTEGMCLMNEYSVYKVHLQVSILTAIILQYN